MAAFLFIVGIIVLVTALIGLIVKALWNWIMPYLFGCRLFHSGWLGNTPFDWISFLWPEKK